MCFCGIALVFEPLSHPLSPCPGPYSLATYSKIGTAARGLRGAVGVLGGFGPKTQKTVDFFCPVPLKLRQKRETVVIFRLRTPSMARPRTRQKCKTVVFFSFLPARDVLDHLKNARLSSFSASEPCEPVKRRVTVVISSLDPIKNAKLSPCSAYIYIHCVFKHTGITLVPCVYI